MSGGNQLKPLEHPVNHAHRRDGKGAPLDIVKKDIRGARLSQSKLGIPRQLCWNLPAVQGDICPNREPWLDPRG